MASRLPPLTSLTRALLHRFEEHLATAIVHFLSTGQGDLNWNAWYMAVFLDLYRGVYDDNHGERKAKDRVHGALKRGPTCPPPSQGPHTRPPPAHPTPTIPNTRTQASFPGGASR